MTIAHPELLLRWAKNFNICVDADANANTDAWGSTIALHERCSGELKIVYIFFELMVL